MIGTAPDICHFGTYRGYSTLYPKSGRVNPFSLSPPPVILYQETFMFPAFLQLGLEKKESFTFC